MTGRWILLCLVICAPGVALAQVLPVRSGEHDGFTRIVVDLPGARNWSLARRSDPRSYRLTLPDSGFSFDLSQVFDRIGRSRLAALTAAKAPGVLDFELACDCSIDATLQGSGMLVLDIAATETAVDDPIEPPGAARSAFTRVDIGAQPMIGPRFRAPRAVESAFQAPDHSDVTKPEDAIEQRFAEVLAAAASQGLLTPGPLRHSPLAKAAAATSEARTVPSRTERPVESPQDAADLFLTQGPDRNHILLSGDRCVPDAKLDIENWAEADPLYHQIGTLRRALSTELDRSDPVAVRGLAQLYLHFGFGVEARSILALADVPDADVLLALSHLVDDDGARSGLFAGQAHCDSAAALWAVLTAPVTPDDEVNAAAVLRGFEALPTHLKPHLAARLSGALQRAGQADAAASVLSRTRRAVEDAGPAVALAEAQQSAADEVSEKVLSDLADIARTADPATSSAAVETLISLSTRQSATVAPDITALASAYVTEYRGAAEAEKLWQAHIRALLGQGAFAEAIEHIAATPDIGADARMGMRAETLAALTDHGSDLTFLRHVLSDLDPARLDLDMRTRERALSRMLDLGMADIALAQIDAPPEAKSSRDLRLLRARALLEMLQPEAAEIALIGLQGAQAQQLRTQARIQMGDYAYAQTVYDAAGESAAALDAAWIAGQWDDVAGREAGVLSAAAALAGSEPRSSDPDAAPSLARSESLADASRETRETLRALLDETRLSPDPAN